MPLARYHQYAQGTQVHIAATVEDSSGWRRLAQTIAAEGRVYVVSVCQHFARSAFPGEPLLAGFPPEADVLSGGGSMIVAPNGEVLAGPLEPGEAIVTAEIDLARVVAEKHSLDVTGHYARSDIFRLTVAETPSPPYRRAGEQVVLDREAFDRFNAMLDNPAAPSEELRALLQNRAPWE